MIDHRIGQCGIKSVDSPNQSCSKLARIIDHVHRRTLSCKDMTIQTKPLLASCCASWNMWAVFPMLLPHHAHHKKPNHFRNFLDLGISENQALPAQEVPTISRSHYWMATPRAPWQSTETSRPQMLASAHVSAIVHPPVIWS